MLSGSRYNDQKERLETRRQSFFVTSSQRPSSFRRFRSAGSPGGDNATSVSRHTLVETTRTRSLDSVSVKVNTAADDTTSIMNSFIPQRSNSNSNDNNPQDDFGLTKSSFASAKNRRMTTLPSKETPLLAGSAGIGKRTRSKSLMPLRSGSCSSLPPIVDEKPVRTPPATSYCRNYCTVVVL
jgi:hypothetical protein